MFVETTMMFPPIKMERGRMTLPKVVLNMSDNDYVLRRQDMDS